METWRIGETPTERLVERGEELESLLEIPRNPEHPRTRQLKHELAVLVFELAWRYREQNNG